MQALFEAHINQHALFNKKDRLLLAISGGVDSVLLAHLLKQAGYSFAMAHCNFGLRASESNKDAAFCNALAKKLEVPIYTTRFETKSYAKKHKLSTQMAARKLRYHWFNTLMQEHTFSYLLTAHHAGDVSETMLLNLIRGTGINGLTGIAAKRNKLVRPLLPFTKTEIEESAKKLGVRFRLDKSNLSDAYDRNYLRLNTIPGLKTLNPSLDETMRKNAYRMGQEAELLKEYLDAKCKNLTNPAAGELQLDIEKLKLEKYPETLLHHVLSKYGFNEAQLADILKSIRGPQASGKLFYTDTHKLTLNRKVMVLRPQRAAETRAESIESLKEWQSHPEFTIARRKKFTPTPKNQLAIDANRLIYPLTLRNWLRGDKFKPFGMKGFKLLSDFLREEKLNTFEKENCPVLLNGNGDVLWVPGRRSDERYRLTGKEKEHLIVTWHANERNIV